jgi:hypothetical protein
MTANLDENPSPPDAPPPVTKASWASATMWMVIVLFLLASALYVFKSFRELPGDAIDKAEAVVKKASQALMDVASAFNQRTITTSFLSYATTVRSSQYLQFATLRQTEVFTQTDEATTGFGYIPLPEVVVEARAPVEYTYYLDLNAKWEFVLKDNVLYVLAPPIKFNKPAVDASEISYEVRKGSMFRDKKQAQENLKKSISFLAHQKARQNVAVVRESGRKQTTEFVEKWLMKSFADGNEHPVKVYFQDETPPSGLEGMPKPLD